MDAEDKTESPTATAQTTARKIPDWERPSDETIALMKGTAPHTVVQAFDLLKCERTVVFETAPTTVKNCEATAADHDALEPHYHWLVLTSQQLKLFMTTGTLNQDWTDNGNESLWWCGRDALRHAVWRVNTAGKDDTVLYAVALRLHKNRLKAVSHWNRL